MVERNRCCYLVLELEFLGWSSKQNKESIALSVLAAQNPSINPEEGKLLYVNLKALHNDSVGGQSATIRSGFCKHFWMNYGLTDNRRRTKVKAKSAFEKTEDVATSSGSKF